MLTTFGVWILGAFRFTNLPFDLQFTQPADPEASNFFILSLSLSLSLCIRPYILCTYFARQSSFIACNLFLMCPSCEFLTGELLSLSLFFILTCAFSSPLPLSPTPSPRAYLLDNSFSGILFLPWLILRLFLTCKPHRSIFSKAGTKDKCLYHRKGGGKDEDDDREKRKDEEEKKSHRGLFVMKRTNTRTLLVPST